MTIEKQKMIHQALEAAGLPENTPAGQIVRRAIMDAEDKDHLLDILDEELERLKAARSYLVSA